ncbi:MAG TPA: hypothetical protein VHO06_14510 [Polyangia bacterium]|nr:hypothetical protein [Polyangia bacterium]
MVGGRALLPAALVAAGCGATAGAARTAGPAAPGPAPDRAAFFGPSRCAAARFALCEDFESGALDPAVWTVGGVAPVVDTGQAARGTHALHVRVTGKGASTISESKTFPAPADTYYGRVFVYFKSLPAPTPAFRYAHWTIVAASGTGVAGEVRLGGQLQGGVNRFGVGTDSGDDPAGSGDWTNPDRDPGPGGAPPAVPTGRWLCLEWMHDGAHQQTRFWWDGVEHPSLATTPATPHLGRARVPFTLPTFTDLWLGWFEYQPTDQPFELWLDEIAVDRARIGCVN